MHRRGLVTFPGQEDAPPGQPLRPLFAFLVKNPIFMTLSDDNYALRLEYVRATGLRPSGTVLLRRKRWQIEQDMARTVSQQGS